MIIIIIIIIIINSPGPNTSTIIKLANKHYIYYVYAVSFPSRLRPELQV